MESFDSIGNAKRIIHEVSRVIVGKDEAIIKVLLAILAGGHILMEDIPGVGKTTLAVSVSRALGLEYNRVQFTPDVLPSDITGYSIYDRNSGEMRYQKGAILCNLFLADELNRATSRTQSALLQAMEEGEVTVDNQTYDVPQPFIVIATQNPTGAKGTQMLPDSQMDRFMLRLSMGYPSHDDEIEMVRRRQSGISADAVQQVVSRDELMELRQEVDQVFVKDSIAEIDRLCPPADQRRHLFDRHIEYARSRHRVEVLAAKESLPHRLVAGDVRQQTQLNLAVVGIYKHLSGRSDKHAADLSPKLVSYRNILQIWFRGGKTSRCRDGHLEAGVYPPVLSDHLKQSFCVSGFKLGQHPVFQHLVHDGMLAAQLFQNICIGAPAGFCLLSGREHQFLKKDLSQLLRRMNIELMPRMFPNTGLQRHDTVVKALTEK